MKLQKTLILLAIPLAIWLFIDNFPAGFYLDQNNWPYKLYISFFNDLMFPFCIYFLLCLFEKWIPGLKPWQVKVVLAFLLPAAIEIGQFAWQELNLSLVFRMYGGAFDPLDLVAFAAGGLLAAFIEHRIFAERFPFWKNSSLEEIA